ncbi:MAG: hypothetical protein CL424_10925 [Acidimicrobiaceae bacterium]|nr:hypothetical protein [Acidimicrobiaceae bacterium]
MTRMETEWLVVKFVADLRRNEPVNVGVMLSTPAGRRSRFKGERNDGTIDGHKVRWAQSADNWRRWVEYWRWEFHERLVDPQAMINEQRASNFVVTYGGRQLAGETNDPDALLDELFGVLVDEQGKPPDAEQASFEREVDQLVRSSRLALDPSFKRDHRITLGERGPYEFPYAWVNGHTTVGYQVGRLRVDTIDAAGFRLTHLPKRVAAVVFTPERLDDTKAAHRALLEVAHEATLGETSPDDLYEMFASSRSADRQARLTR